MDTATLVEEQIAGGKELVRHLKQAGFEVTVSFWALTSEDQLWHLYIASPSVDNDGLDKAYRKLYSELSRSAVHWVSRSDIKLISSQNLSVQDALKFQGDVVDTRYGGRTLGNLIVEDALIYPKNA